MAAITLRSPLSATANWLRRRAGDRTQSSIGRSSRVSRNWRNRSGADSAPACRIAAAPYRVTFLFDPSEFLPGGIFGRLNSEDSEAAHAAYSHRRMSLEGRFISLMQDELGGGREATRRRASFLFLIRDHKPCCGKVES